VVKAIEGNLTAGMQLRSAEKLADESRELVN